MAAELLLKRGLGAVSMDAVAEQACVTMEPMSSGVLLRRHDQHRAPGVTGEVVGRASVEIFV